jgi:hypothetical protein
MRVRRSVQIEDVPVPTSETVTEVRSPMRVHLLDLSMVVFRFGASVTPDSVRGAGRRWDARLRDLGPVSSVPLDSVLGMEAMGGGTIN